MSVRFRIRTSQGQELSFATHEMFEEFVRSGDLSPDDVVYDGETGEWAPARTHPLILEIEYEQEEAAAKEKAESGDATAVDPGLDIEAPQEGGHDDASGAVDEGDVGAPEEASSAGGDSFGLELAPAAEAMTAEEEAAAFVAKMESERAMDLDYDRDSQSMQGFTMEDSRAYTDVAPVPPAPAPPTPAPPPPPPPPSRRERKERRERSPEPRRRSPEKKGGLVKKLLFFLLMVGVAGSAGYFALVRGGPIDDDPVVPAPTVQADPEPEPEPEPPPPEPVIASTEDAVRERAQERFLNATQTLFRDLEPIPEVWLQGAYMALPSDYAEIRGIWERYRTVARDARSAEEDRYRTAYEDALDDAAVTGDARGSRTEAAVEDFAMGRDAREAHWNRVDALAMAALQSHDALVEAEGLILFDPTGATGRSGSIGAGASGRDSDGQRLLDQVVSLMEGVLDADGMGPRTGSNVREWSWGGFLDTVTR